MKSPFPHLLPEIKFRLIYSMISQDATGLFPSTWRYITAGTGVQGYVPERVQ